MRHAGQRIGLRRSRLGTIRPRDNGRRDRAGGHPQKHLPAGQGFILFHVHSFIA
jgi:hypothetical protein